MIPYKSNRLKDINKEACNLFAISVTMDEIKVLVSEFLVLNQRTIHHVVCRTLVREMRLGGAHCH